MERAPLEREIAALLEQFGDGDAQLRLVITRGGRRIAATEPLPDKGVTVTLATVAYSPTIILTGVKSLSYGANMQATRLGQARGADEALLVRPDGIVLEAPTSTIFWASDGGSLKTPGLGSGILDSITRRRIVEELEVEEGEYTLEDVGVGAPRPSWPRPCARSSRSPGSTTTGWSPAARGPPRRARHSTPSSPARSDSARRAGALGSPPWRFNSPTSSG